MKTSPTDADLPQRMGPPEPGTPEAAVQAALRRLPPRLRRSVAQLLSQWPGRIALRSAASCIRIEIFDRSMTIAAQFFTSVFPILILLATWVGAAGSAGIAEAVDMPDESRSVLDQAVQSSGGTTFGIVGTLIVLVSATSLSRALTRAFAAIWHLPRPKSSLKSAWRWLAVVVALALSLVVVRALSGFVEEVPPRNFWERMVVFAFDLLTASLRALALAVRCRPTSPPASRRPDLRELDVGGSPGVGPVAAARPRGQRRPVWLDRRGVHLPGVVVRRVLLRPPDGCRRSGGRRGPRLARETDSRPCPPGLTRYPFWPMRVVDLAC